MWRKYMHPIEPPRPNFTRRKFDPFQPEGPRKANTLGFTGVFENFDAYLRPPLWHEIRKVDLGVANRYIGLIHRISVGGSIRSWAEIYRWRKQRDQFYNWLFKNNFPKDLRYKIIKSLNRAYKDTIL